MKCSSMPLWAASQSASCNWMLRSAIRPEVRLARRRRRSAGAASVAAPVRRRRLLGREARGKAVEGGPDGVDFEHLTLRDSGRTTRPRRATRAANCSVSSRSSASRTGVRLTPNCLCKLLLGQPIAWEQPLPRRSPRARHRRPHRRRPTVRAHDRSSRLETMYHAAPGRRSVGPSIQRCRLAGRVTNLACL